MARPNEFSRATQQQALARQRHRCGSCGTRIFRFGEAGRDQHRFGEVAHAHHVQHLRFGGSDSVHNCVILCQSCHYSAHEGGRYSSGTVVGRDTDYPHFWG